MFTVFVAIDIKGGQVVRLLRGDPAAATVYGSDPVETAQSWQRQGATYLHVVDLDGAIGGAPPNRGAVGRIVSEIGVPVEVAGGIRSLEAIEAWLTAGAARVCIGTKALDPVFLESALEAFGADRIVAAVDARDGFVQVSGWQESSTRATGEVIAQLAGAGVARVLFTDIGRDGTLEGPNLAATKELLSSGIGVIASGGVSGVGDIEALVAFGDPRLEGVVVGRALYSGALSLADALTAAAGGAGAPDGAV
ncbi:MAG: 1-(5-phosphoribosyl)-5-[(5-phosphoribosylamino)methylideneamino] imidazole-4-carboxamide isomerase, partial [Actinomycetota bacterium]